MVLCSDVGISFALLTILRMDLLLVKLMDANLPSEILNILKQ